MIPVLRQTGNGRIVAIRELQLLKFISMGKHVLNL